MNRLLKRFLDLVVAVTLLILLSPLIGLVSLGVWLTMGRPVFFRQPRPGYRAKPFVLLKFRTLTLACDSAGASLPDELRLTAFGKVLRRLSLDELPQLLNVCKGEMSLVGPRPLLMHYVKLYSPGEARRHEVRPGITGWAQVNGRNALTWEEKFALDCWYVDHWNFWLDLRILARTIRRVLSGEGISRKGHATMPEFSGSHYSEP